MIGLPEFRPENAFRPRRAIVRSSKIALASHREGRTIARNPTLRPLLVGVVVLIVIIVVDVFVVLGIDVSAARPSAAALILLVVIIIDRRDRSRGVQQQRQRGYRFAKPARRVGLSGWRIHASLL